MALEDKIVRQSQANPVKKIPIIVTMVDSNGTFREIPFRYLPFTSGAEVIPGDIIYGVELIVNPASMSTNIAKLIGRTQSMSSWVEDHWGEEIDTITLQGNTASFITGGSKELDETNLKASDPYTIRLTGGSLTQKFLNDEATAPNKRLPSSGIGMGIHDNEIGLTVSQRRATVSYVQFKRLVDLFRFNGCMFDDFGLVKGRYFVVISYGRQAYKGFFESIDVTEIAENPFRFQYTITFKSQETIYSYIKQPTMRNA